MCVKDLEGKLKQGYNSLHLNSLCPNTGDPLLKHQGDYPKQS